MTTIKKVAPSFSHIRTDLRQVSFRINDPEKSLDLPTNNVEIDALIATRIFLARRQTEVFLKRIKQNLRLKFFSGLSKNPTKT